MNNQWNMSERMYTEHVMFDVVLDAGKNSFERLGMLGPHTLFIIFGSV